MESDRKTTILIGLVAIIFCGAPTLFAAGPFADAFALPTDGAAESSAETTADSMFFSQEVILRGALGLDSCRAFQIWGNFYTAGGNLEPDGTVKTFDQDFDGTMIGLTIGLGTSFSLSGYYNYQDASVKSGGIKNKTETNLGGASIRYNVSSFYFSLLGNYGDDASTMEGAGRQSLDYDGWQATGFFETGFQWPTSGRLFVLTPFSNLQYSTVKFDAFDRGAFALTDDSVHYDAFYQTLGSRIDLNFLSSLGLQARLAWIHQYLNEEAPINNYQMGRIPGTISPTTVFYEGSPGRDWFWGGVGAKLSLFNMLSITVDYDVLLNELETTHIGSVGLMIGF